MKPSHRILLAPLDWGLGHTTRIIPVGRELQRQGATLLLAGTPAQLSILAEAFPGCVCLDLKGYQVRYGKFLPASWHVIRQFPRLIRVIRQEQKWIIRIVSEYQITGIISDNRYGIYHPDCNNVMLMHQFVPPLSGLAAIFRPLLWKAHRKFLRPFDQIWIPDVAGEQSLGKEMRPPQLPANSRFIGWLSRLQEINRKPTLMHSQMGEPDLLVLLSGPEPQRSILEHKIRQQMDDPDVTCWIVQGLPTNKSLPEKIPGGWLIPYMNGADLIYWLPKAKVVLARSGYSSLMDFAFLGLEQVALIPTPGQPEQLLLANHLSDRRIAHSVSQHSFTLKRIFSEVPDFHGFKKSSIEKDQLVAAVGSWLT